MSEKKFGEEKGLRMPLASWGELRLSQNKFEASRYAMSVQLLEDSQSQRFEVLLEAHHLSVDPGERSKVQPLCTACSTEEACL
jgi:hypothetical protein